ncbi:MAG: hypothetical protein WDA27_04685 [Actinomycetota bacterium]
MATVLIVEDEPDLAVYEAKLLEDAGHCVVMCGGSRTPKGGCDLIRCGVCAVPETVDVILFSCRLFAPLEGQTSEGARMIRAYRSHPRYSHIPLLVVFVTGSTHLPGTGPIELIGKFNSPTSVLDSVSRLLQTDRRDHSGRGPLAGTEKEKVEPRRG